jgi:hypothetical protein
METASELISEVIAPFETIFPEFCDWLCESLAAGELDALQELIRSDKRISCILDNLEGTVYRPPYALMLGYYLAKQEESSHPMELAPPTGILH